MLKSDRLAAHTQDDGFHEIQLNGKQLVFLFMAATVVSVVIFLCGVLVGRGVRAETGGSPPRPPRWRTRPRRRCRRPRRLAAPPAGSDPAAAPPASRRRSELLQPSREAESAGREAEGEGDTRAGAGRAAAAPAASARHRRCTSRPRLWPAVSRVGRRRRREPAAPQRLTRCRSPRSTSAARRTRSPSGLPSKGYAAYVLPPANGTPAVYRVRVGKFKTRREAETIAAKLQKEEQFKPWVTR